MTDPYNQELSWWFYLNAVYVVVAIGIGFINWKKAWGIPSMLVFVTVGVWYLFDIIYNDVGTYYRMFSPLIVNDALSQVTIFLGSYSLMLIPVTALLSSQNSGEPNSIDPDYTSPDFQRDLDRSFGYLIFIWLTLAIVGLTRIEFDLPGFLFPYLSGYVNSPWDRERVGGSMDFLISTGGYIYIFICSMLGVVWMLSRNLRNRVICAFLIFLAWPHYLFGRTRSEMLAIITPALIAFAFIRRDNWMKKTVVLGLLFLVINTWMLFVIDYRGRDVAWALVEGRNPFAQREDTEHLGLNMFEELCWINHLINEGQFKISNGGRYFAEAVNWIPRAIWKDKPLIGIDYAFARGQGGGKASAAGVHATISTGMIGQGIVNFGFTWGPVSAAMLMAIWTAILGKLWSERERFLRIGLFLLGVGLTFNMGRDITLIILFPMLFGFLLVKVYEELFRK